MILFNAIFWIAFLFTYLNNCEKWSKLNIYMENCVTAFLMSILQKHCIFADLAYLVLYKLLWTLYRWQPERELMFHLLKNREISLFRN